LLGLSPGLAAAASNEIPPVAPTPAATTSSASEPSSEASVDGLGRRVDSGILARLSGGSELSQSITIHGTVSDNHVDHAISGDNVIGGDALRGAMGLPMVIQNTGNGVLIQNATIVNVQLQP
jgi:hypothetical protein